MDCFVNFNTRFQTSTYAHHNEKFVFSDKESLLELLRFMLNKNLGDDPEKYFKLIEEMDIQFALNIGEDFTFMVADDPEDENTAYTMLFYPDDMKQALVYKYSPLIESLAKESLGQMLVSVVKYFGTHGKIPWFRKYPHYSPDNMGFTDPQKIGLDRIVD